MNHKNHVGAIRLGRIIALGVALCLVGPAARSTEDVAALSAGNANLLQKYPRLSLEPFGKGVFCHVRAGGKIRGSSQSIRALAENPYVSGTQLSYCWSELEPTEGRYRWDIIEEDMEVWAQNGKKCWLEVATAFRWDASGGKPGARRWHTPNSVLPDGIPASSTRPS